MQAQHGAAGRPDGPRNPLAVRDGRSERRLTWLLFARLLLSAVSLVIAIGLDALGRELSDEARLGLYWTVAGAFLATALSAAAFKRIRRPQLFAAVQISLDVAIVSALVHFSGGRESIFIFLYVLVAVYGALLFGRQGAVVAASVSAIGYGVALLTTNGVWIELARAPTGSLALPVLVVVWGMHVGALALVGGLASQLSGELQRTGEALHRSTSDLNRLRDLHRWTVESIMSGLVTTNSAGRVTSFNPEAERITGATMEEVVDCQLEEVIPGASQLFEEGVGFPSGSQIPRVRVPYRNLHGEELFLGLAGSILKGEDGSSLGHVVIFQDVTAVVAMERQLRRSERLAAVGEMSAKMAHEIRNPLAAMSGSIQVLRSDLGEDSADPERRRLMNIVEREADRLNRLITDFLAFARPMRPKRESVALGGLAREVLEMLDSVRPENISVELHAVKPVCVQGDSGQLRQVLWNLFHNAVEAMPQGGRLDICVEDVAGQSPQGASALRRSDEQGRDREGTGEPGWVKIVVADTGIGISSEVQEQIFEPFFTTKKEGTGLGLSTVHRIVEGHGGSLELESTEGVGTSFLIWLPQAEERA
jgi:two-component system sensor histidine kinase PilS (NtrC family)